eukprot:TRINITY_DN4045_c0_g2_i10.p1 TRINITY_DN4045_c0_g2~~TRINITY_DN4045_c0_g2_i10.p1  ORF type:complete len:266 (+),score=40.88 TRINITY_DN4045_c0_g2_i10:220-1017(+)
MNHRSIMETRMNKNPRLFNRQNWRKIREGNKLRCWVYECYLDKIDQFTWNDNVEVPIIPVLHATDLTVAKKICETGFAALSSLDSGYFGRGIYFSTSANYIQIYWGPDPAVIVSYVCPGNVYPVIESPKGSQPLTGTALKTGYNSHYICVNRDGSVCEKSSMSDHYDELVIEQESQITPAFILQVCKKTDVKPDPLLNSFPRHVQKLANRKKLTKSLLLSVDERQHGYSGLRLLRDGMKPEIRPAAVVSDGEIYLPVLDETVVLP